MPYVDSKGSKIHYEEKGSGDPILFLPGLGATCSSWPVIFDELSKTNRCITLDHRGLGQSENPSEKFSINDMADDALAVLDALNISTASLIGNSLGGMIAQAIAINHPNRITSLVLLSSAPGFYMIPLSSQALKIFWQVFITKKNFTKLHLHLDRNNHHVSFAANSQIKEFSQTVDLVKLSLVIKQQLLAAAKWHALSKLGRIDAPTLVVHGGKDIIVPVFQARLTKWLLPKARMTVVKNASHFILADAGELVAQEISNFYLDASLNKIPARVRRRAWVGNIAQSKWQIAQGKIISGTHILTGLMPQPKTQVVKGSQNEV